MMAAIGETPVPVRRSVFWRIVQVAAGLALIFYALKLLAPLPLARGSFVLLAALVAAGSMALTDSIVGVLVALLDRRSAQ